MDVDTDAWHIHEYCTVAIGLLCCSHPTYMQLILLTFFIFHRSSMPEIVISTNWRRWKHSQLWSWPGTMPWWLLLSCSSNWCVCCLLPNNCNSYHNYRFAAWLSVFWTTGCGRLQISQATALPYPFSCKHVFLHVGVEDTCHAPTMQDCVQSWSGSSTLLLCSHWGYCFYCDCLAGLLSCSVQYM